MNRSRRQKWLRPTVHLAFIFHGLSLLLQDTHALAVLNGAEILRRQFLCRLVSSSRKEQSPLQIPLKFLPRAGCLAVSILVKDSYGYLAVVDTGSPFLTVPADCVYFSQPSLRFRPSREQYGQASGRVKWRRSRVKLSDTDQEGSLVFCIPDATLVDDTGGIFAGLMVKDAVRPTLLGQLGYPSFRLDYANQLLTLSSRPLLDEDSISLDLFDWNGYNKYH